MENNEKTLWKIVKGYFNALPDKAEEAKTIEQISSGVTFHGANLWVLVFAVFIASLGLNVNSTAVIIGAMLISPLMGPIVGMGLGIGISDLALLKRSIKNYLVATGISVLTATLYFLITPLTEAQSELLARTSPTLYDVLIALCGGAAGILALSTRGSGNVIPGVAIATALMPPLCTAGYGLAMGEPSFFFGAFYLYFINTVFITLTTFVGVRMLRFKQKQFIDAARMVTVKRYIIGIVVLTMLPAAYMTVQIIRQSVLENNSNRFVRNELAFKGTQIISQQFDTKHKTLNIVAVGKIISKEEIAKAEKMLESYNLEDYKLHIIQGLQSDSLLLANQQYSYSSGNTQASQQKLIEQVAQLGELEQQLNAYQQYATLTKEVHTELKAVCPSAKSISISRVTEAKTDTAASQEYVMAVVNCPRALSSPDRQRLQEWLKVRTKVDSLRVIVTSF
ncbi:TIGR00341 family protein [uncultured Alloprevotella sp.]|uniref:TIGR00341 family protein n=1 Tax=uncultured Alloprevotella sp. TaxID=1283315 RepID=UPI00325FC04B